MKTVGRQETSNAQDRGGGGVKRRGIHPWQQPGRPTWPAARSATSCVLSGAPPSGAVSHSSLECPWMPSCVFTVDVLWRPHGGCFCGVFTVDGFRMEAQLYSLRASATRLTGKYWAAPYASSLLPRSRARARCGIGLLPQLPPPLYFCLITSCFQVTCTYHPCIFVVVARFGFYFVKPRFA